MKQIKRNILVLITLLFSGFAYAQTSVTPIEVVVSEDSYVYDAATSKGTNYGTEDGLVIKGDASGYRRDVYMKINLSSVDFTSYNDIQLKVNVKAAQDDIDKILWVVNATSNDWTETTLTWNNKPDAINEIASAAGNFADADVYFDISAYVLSEIEKGNKTLSLHITSTTVSTGKFHAQFHSKEAADETKRPRLVISYKEKSDEKEEDIYDLIMDRIQTRQKSSAKAASIDANVVSYLTKLNTDGSFSDLNYAETSQTNWGPISHLDRLKSFVLAYTMEGSSYYEDESIFNKIESMFSCWQNKDPRSTNWYMQQIAAPQRMGILLILMRTGKNPLNQTLETAIIQRMASIGGAPDQSGSQGTGANKVDIATHWVYRGCLTKSKTVLEKGIQQAFYPLFHTTGEGFQHDYSYLQHGQQLYIGGYGDVIAQGICNLAQYVSGTEYALSDEKFDILFNFMRKTYLSVIRGQYFLYNAAGRSLSRPNAMSKKGFEGTLELLRAVDVNNVEVYDNAIKRITGEKEASFGVEPYHAHYWRSDYTLHQRPGFTFDVRMVSTRTLRNENGNGENIKGYFLSEGATDIAIDGDEYYNIFPVWDWGRIPGTTTPALTTIPKPAQWGTSGKNSFVGGVSDGLYGVSTYAMSNYEYSSVNTEAKKSWFFFDNEVVCLGAGIKSTAALQVNTTMNQCLLDGDVTVVKSDNSSEVYTASQKASRTFDNNLSWVLHGKVGYYLPSGGNIVVSNQSQSGSWPSINTAQTGSTINKDVFKLYFNHGEKPVGEQYAYVVAPNVNTIEKANAYNTENINILSNTELIQAVEHKELGVLGIVFYGPATFTYKEGVTIKANRACTVMLKNLESDNVDVYVADPSASLTEVSLIVDLPGIENVKELKCEFSTNKAEAGLTKYYVINAETPDYNAVADNSIYISVSDDSYVHGGNKTTNYGTSTVLELKTDSEAYTRQVFLKFNIKDVDLSNAEKIELMLAAAEGDDDYLNNTLQIWACGSDWSETTVNWNNKPTSTGSVVASAKAVLMGEPLLLDITDYILNEKAKSTETVSFRLGNTYTGAVSKTRISFHSKESLYEDMRPSIKITPIEKVGIDGPAADAADGIVVGYVYYTLQGIQLTTAPQTEGLYIQKTIYSNKKATAKTIYITK